MNLLRETIEQREIGFDDRRQFLSAIDDLLPRDLELRILVSGIYDDFDMS